MPTPSQMHNLRSSASMRTPISEAPRNVLREDRSKPAPGAEAAVDQSAVAVESGFLFDQSADFRFTIAHGLRKRAMPESLGMLEPGHRYSHDRRGSLHARMRILRGD